MLLIIPYFHPRPSETIASGSVVVHKIMFPFQDPINPPQKALGDFFFPRPSLSLRAGLRRLRSHFRDRLIKIYHYIRASLCQFFPPGGQDSTIILYQKRLQTVTVATLSLPSIKHCYNQCKIKSHLNWTEE